MEKIYKLLIDKYEQVLSDLLIGHPMNKQKVHELIELLHIMHFLGFDKKNSNLSLEILAYYV